MIAPGRPWLVRIPLTAARPQIMAGHIPATSPTSNFVKIGTAAGPASSRKGLRALMLTKVVRIEQRGGFRLWVRFIDGSEGVHDFAAMVGEPGLMLTPLRDEAYFARVCLEFGMAYSTDLPTGCGPTGRGFAGDAWADGLRTV